MFLKQACLLLKVPANGSICRSVCDCFDERTAGKDLPLSINLGYCRGFLLLLLSDVGFETARGPQFVFVFGLLPFELIGGERLQFAPPRASAPHGGTVVPLISL